MDGIAAFDLPDSGTPDPSGEMVLYPDSVLMIPGDYSGQKGINLTADDLRRAAEEFSGFIPNVLHHYGAYGIEHALNDSDLGGIRDLWLDESSDKLKGTVAIPRGLDMIWKGPKKVSTEWDPKTKTLKALGLCVKKPFIPEAVLMSGEVTEVVSPNDADVAFAASQGERTFEGASTLQPMPAFAGTGNWKVGAARDLPLLDDNDAGWDGPAAEKSIFGDGDTVPADARRAFLVYDASAPDLKGSYKLPFAVRKDDGKLYASRAGLRIAATRIPKTDADEAALTRARAVVDGYQARFAKLDKGGKDKGGTATMAANTTATPDRIALIRTAKAIHDELDLMPGYGLLFVLPDSGHVWWVAGDGDGKGTSREIESRLKKVDGVTDVTVESEGYPPKDDGWEQVYPAPRKGRAAAFAAPIRHESATTYMQSVHDAAAEMDPAVCEPGTKAARPDKAKGKDMPAAFADHPEQFKAIKAMHDMAVKHGATCPGMPRTATMSGDSNGSSNSNRTPPAFRKGGNPPAAPTRGGGHRKMNWREKLAALFGTEPDNLPPMDEEVARTGVSLFTAGPGEVTVEDETMTQTTMNTTAGETPAAPDPAATFAALLAKNAELEDRIRRQEEEDQRRRVHELDQQAATFAADLCKDKVDSTGRVVEKAKLTPAAFSLCEALYKQAAQDDAAAQAVVTFSAGGQDRHASRVEALATFVKALPGHGLLGQQLDPSGRLDPAKAAVLFNEGNEPRKSDPAVVQRMLAATSVGRQPAASANGSGSSAS